MRVFTAFKAGRSRKLLALFLLGLALFWSAAFFDQRSLMYHPDDRPFDPMRVDLQEQLKPVTFPGLEGDPITHWFAPPAQDDMPIVVYFQGNAKGLENRAHKYAHWIAQGYGVFLVGYPGYGNPGKPSEASLYQAGRGVLTYLHEWNPKWKIVLYGESLGTGIAAQMALEYPKIAGLILEAPYTSYPDVGAVHYPYLPVHLLALDRYETIEKIGQVTVPLLVIHGTADQVVPFAQGKRVFESAKEPKEFAFLEGAGHGDLYDFGAGEVVDKFLLAFR